MDQPTSSFNRKYISVMFDCCQVYSRIYINPEGTGYFGRCPKCLAAVKAIIGENGTSARTFRAH
jgi:hypothetical protein